MQYASYLRDQETVPVPESIEFGEHCVVAPELESVDIPPFLAQLPLLTPKISVGSWVKRGDLLLVALLPVFDAREPPPKWTFWVKDSFTYLSYELRSPASGLVLDMKEQKSAYHGNAAYTDSGESICYGRNQVRPVILLPNDEPPPLEWSFYDSLADSLKMNYHQLLHSSSSGYVRAPETVEAFLLGQQRLDIEKFCTSNESVSTPAVEVLHLRQIPGADRFVNSMRSHNLLLRRKLRHIGGLAADQAVNPSVRTS